MLMPDSICRVVAPTIAAILMTQPVVASAQVPTPPVRWFGGSQDVGAFEFTRDTTVAHRSDKRARFTSAPSRS